MFAPQKAVRPSLLVTSAALLSLSVTALSSGPALAAPRASSAAKPSPSATPPATMSAVGGDRLALPGTQADLAPGVPALPKDLTGRSWIVADAESGQVLAAHNAHWKLPPASTLKMLFADTVLPGLPSAEKHKVELSDLAGMGAGSSLVGIKENETYTVRDLWLGVFLRSGNDAVHVLAAMNGGVAKTVADMNAKAKELQALDTHVVTPDGYDAKGQVSSAYDLTLFAAAGLKNEDFRKYCSTVRAQFPGETKKVKGKTVRKSFEIQNTDRLLTGDYDLPAYQGIAGVKNGNTTNAGATYTGVAERNGHVLLVTVMNPENKRHNSVYREAAALLDWGFKADGKVPGVGQLEPPASATGTSGASATPSGRASGAAGAPHSGGGTQASAAADSSGSSGMWIALGITGGVLVLLAGGAYLVNRRWPLPELVRRRH